MYECGDDAIIVDCGMAFPDDTMLGIDMVIPDITYVAKNIHKVRAILLTHGHEDHIGAIPYALRSINPPIYGTKLTLGIIKNKLSEHVLANTPKLCEVKAGDVIEAGAMSVEFIHVNHSIADACALAIKTPLGTILHTGDLIDFVSTANLELAKQFTDEHDVFMAAGNHEFSLYVGEAKEDAAYRNQSLAMVQEAFKNDIRMSSRVIGGVNFIALDNGYYLFEKEQLDFLKEEAKKNLPMILLMHNPIHEMTLYHWVRAESPCAYLVGVPEELMQDYPADRFEQQRADAITLETVEYIKTEPLIKAVIAGHLHRNYRGYLTPTLPQIATSCTDFRILEIT
jgi:3',5'-cyclic AMP phosphodiesterase CpdA